MSVYEGEAYLLELPFAEVATEDLGVYPEGPLRLLEGFDPLREGEELREGVLLRPLHLLYLDEQLHVFSLIITILDLYDQRLQAGAAFYSGVPGVSRHHKRRQ